MEFFLPPNRAERFFKCLAGFKIYFYTLLLCFPVCADCVVEWGKWSNCVDGRRSRAQEITVESSGTGQPCPIDLMVEAECKFW